MAGKIALKLRKMLESDFAFVRTVFNEGYRDAYPKGLTSTEFHQFIYHQNLIALVAMNHGDQVGFMVLTNYRFNFEIEYLVVPPKYRRNGIATEFVSHLLKNHHQDKRRIGVNLCEKLVASHYFFTKLGFHRVNSYPAMCGCGADLNRYIFQLKDSPCQTSQTPQT